jgi:hypothetical protein
MWEMWLAHWPEQNEKFYNFIANQKTNKIPIGPIVTPNSNRLFLIYPFCRGIGQAFYDAKFVKIRES